jgi:hypothetical protein
MQRMRRMLVMAGLAAAAAFPSIGASSAGAATSAESATTAAAADCWVVPPGGLACWRGPYSSLGTCNYWRGAYPPGSVISECMWLTGQPEGPGWYFAEKVR